MKLILQFESDFQMFGGEGEWQKWILKTNFAGSKVALK